MKDSSFKIRRRAVAVPSGRKNSLTVEIDSLKDRLPDDLSSFISLEQIPTFSYPLALGCFLVPALLSATYATISDCDEVFNYWEPTHYLVHGYGLQTWEYSPEYAIRSWFYVALHALISRLPSMLLPFLKATEFYILRYSLAIFCACCETRLFVIISNRINPTVGVLFGLNLSLSAGMYNATSAYLPSSFAMYFVMLGMADFLEYPQMTARSIFWFAVAGLMGWPFSLAFAIPFVLDSMLEPIIQGNVMTRYQQILKGVLCTFLLLAVLIGIDSLAYKKLAIVPLNIVLYNVFGETGKGPNIFGTEPWWFYLANLAINFNVVLPFGLMCIPLMVTMNMLGYKTYQKSVYVATIPFYLWFSVFSFQPHKEERFFFVSYPALCFNAAICIRLIHFLLTSLAQKRPKLHLSVNLMKLVLHGILLVGLLLGISRTLAVTSAYSAPLQVYKGLSPDAVGNLCLGKEWYRFPSSYFLPANVRAKFIKSSFDGLLPGEFPEATLWSRPGTWMFPKGMNDQNIEDLSKYVNISECNYLVDSHFDSSSANDLEPTYITDTNEWSMLRCERFLDVLSTPTLSRVFYIPFGKFKGERQWGKYCLLQKRK